MENLMNNPNPSTQTPTKTCAKCHQSIPAVPDNFYRDKRSSDGFNSYCISCSRLASAATHKRQRDRLLAYRESVASSTPLTPDQLVKHGFKVCSSCEITKPATRTYFHTHAGSRDGFHSACKQCRNALARSTQKRPYQTPSSFLKQLATKKLASSVNTQLTNVFPE